MTHERHKLQTLIAGVVLAGLAFVPLYAWLTGDMYVLTLFGRILAFSLAALGLNLALGFGGMVSLGHAMYMGLGAYTVGILSSLGVYSGWVHLICTAFITILIATPLSWVALRTQGIAFIMITLAFAQLFYYVFVSLKMFGGDDGISMKQLSDFGVLTGNKFAIYISLLMALFLSIWVMHKIVASQFGLLLRASKTNNRRVKALGSHTLTYRMTAYVISALLCALAGFFLANLTGFVSPAMMTWSISGELIVMVLLGGVGSVFGPIVGALAFLLTEEGLKLLTERWPLILGPLIVLIVIYLKHGLWGLWSKR